MQADGESNTDVWPPQAFDMIMKAYRRKGDLLSVKSWYTQHLKARAHQRTSNQDLPVQPIRPGDVTRSEAERSQALEQARLARPWPHLTLLHAYDDPRMADQRDSADSFMIKTVLENLREDDLDVPAEIYGQLIKLSSLEDNFDAVGSTWEQVVQKISRHEDKHRILPIAVYVAMFNALSLHSDYVASEGGHTQHALSTPRQIAKIMVKDRRWPISGPMRRLPYKTSDSKLSSLMRSIIGAGLSHDDPTLVLWALKQYDKMNLYVDLETIQVIALWVLLTAIKVYTGTLHDPHWLTAVLGRNALREMAWCHESLGSLYKDSAQGTTRNHGRPREELWDIITARLHHFAIEAAVQHDRPPLTRMVHFPLNRARLQPSNSHGELMDAGPDMVPASILVRKMRLQDQQRDHAERWALGRATQQILKLCIDSGCDTSLDGEMKRLRTDLS